jgi:hypothetical protein
VRFVGYWRRHRGGVEVCGGGMTEDGVGLIG